MKVTRNEAGFPLCPACGSTLPRLRGGRADGATGMLISGSDREDKGTDEVTARCGACKRTWSLRRGDWTGEASAAAQESNPPVVRRHISTRVLCLTVATLGIALLNVVAISTGTVASPATLVGASTLIVLMGWLR